MIVRIWRGEVSTEHADVYEGLMLNRAVPDYRAIPGNTGAWCLRRRLGDNTEFLMLTVWQDLASIRAFAGENLVKARYYDFDPQYLLAMVDEAEHFYCAEVLAD